ncbi:MAG: CPBP family intramembrane glutamic endopeptidase, partial [Bythopirellula sp.]
VRCWRCGLKAPETAEVCPHCAARLKQVGEAVSKNLPGAQRSDAIKVLMWSYALLLATTIALAFSIELTLGDEDFSEEKVRAQALYQMLVVGFVDIVIVCSALALGYRTIKHLSTEAAHRALAWIVFTVMLPLLLLLNFAYHWLLREVLQIPLLEDELTATLDWLVFLVYCIEPAVVEELYCRGFVLGVLLSVLGRHWAIWISSIMFGLLHVGAPLSIPYLTLVGVFLGYARIYSGGLALPVLLHFVHNLIVLLWD